MATIKRSSAARGRSSLGFVTYKTKNMILELLALYCPINSLRVAMHRWRGVRIGENVFIGLNCTLDHAYPEYIRIDDNAMIAGDVYILAHSKAPEQFAGKLISYVAAIHIRQDAWIGVRSVLLPGVTVGKGAIVSAGAVVMEDVPDHTVVRGNPATVIRKI